MKKHMLCILIILFCFTFLSAADWDQITKIVASDRGAEDYFSKDVAISGNYAIVGAYREDHDVSGGDVIHDAGAAYIFQFDGTGWVEMQKLVASDRQEDAQFGFTVDICGNYAIVGAPQETQNYDEVDELYYSGAAYVFYNNGSSWELQQKILSTDLQIGDAFGYSVALTQERAVIGAIYEDHEPTGEDSVDCCGAAYVFSRSGAIWSQESKLVPSYRDWQDYFGHKVAIDGDYVVVGTPYEDHDIDNADYEPQAGAVYVFKNYSGSGWAQQQKIVASDRDMSDYFGHTVDISENFIIVGAYMEDHDPDGADKVEKAGSAYIYKLYDVLVSPWYEDQKIVASERWASDFFGKDVAIDGNMIIVGASGEDHDTSATNYIGNAGAAYIFNYDSTAWIEQEKIIASDRAENDAFGNKVDISDATVIVGAIGEDQDADGANTKTGSGSAYIFSSGIGGTVSPEINIQYDSMDITNGDSIPSLEDHTDFGTTHINTGNIINAYLIQNTGTGVLTLSTPVITGIDSGDFSLLTTSSDSILAGFSSAFSIIFSPLAVGMREATISIVNNDADENPYTFAIQGTGKTPYSGGSGTEVDPYLIANYNDLLELSAMTHDWDKFFVQTANIDAEASDSLNMGDHDANLSTPEEAMGFSPIGDSPTAGDRQGVAFSGSYNGNGYTTSNLYINRPEEELIGFFGYVKDVSHTQKTAIKNINLLDVDINGHGYTGGLVGWNLDASIDSCNVNGNVTSLSGTVGGLVGFDQDIITACHTLCVVSGGTAGGLVGYKEFGKIINSSSRDMVHSPTGTAGGVVGSMYQAEIQNSQASGSVTAYRYTGGFAGKIQYRSKITNCYVRSDVTGSAPSAYNATGGFCGYVNGYGINLGSNIENCFSTSLVHYTGTADPTDRGFVGMVALTNTFINNFFVVTSSSQLTDAAGAATPKDSIAMSDITTFTDISTEGLTSAWDFAYNFNDDAGDDDIWDMDTSGAFNDGYPFLFWENGDDVALPEVVGISDQNIPDEFGLDPAYPNPFNPRTAISYQLSAVSFVNINIYNTRGELVDQLINGFVEKGKYELVWDASDMPSGVYIIRMRAGDFIASQKVVLIK